MRGEAMHFEILVEDFSGKKALDILIPKIIGDSHTFKVHPYKGVGHIPKSMKNTQDASKRLLLDNLPKLLKGYGKSFRNYAAAIFVVCDLDEKCLKAFRQELLNILNACHPKPTARFCIAIEEGEAWFLGDISAVKKAYPRAKDAILLTYSNDSICGTWELLANAIYPGGATALSKAGYQTVGMEKSKWAEAITPHMEIGNNKSPSFNYFLRKMQELAAAN
jgi:hypothetical protein